MRQAVDPDQWTKFDDPFLQIQRAEGGGPLDILTPPYSQWVWIQHSCSKVPPQVWFDKRYQACPCGLTSSYLGRGQG